MKMYLIVYAKEADEAVIAALKKSGIKAYTKMEEACGEGTETDQTGDTYLAGSEQCLVHGCPQPGDPRTP